MDSYLPHVGYVQFPRRPEDLTSGVCPACFAPRTAPRCPNCGLDLAHPAVAELDAAGTDVSAALDRRLELIGRIRYESALAAAAPVAAPVAAAPAAPPQPTPRPEPLEVEPQPPRRHLGVQVILLIVGVSLLAVGAIFFLVYAFITFGLVWRSVIIGAVTVASFVGASLLRRRRLGATAEAIAALAVVFVYLDAFALRANDLFGLGDSDGFVYSGTALLVSAVGFAAWHRLSGLRLPSIVAFLSFPPAAALLTYGLTEGVDDGVRAFAAFLVLALAALAHPLARGRAVERTISLWLALAGLVAASVTALWMLPDDDWAPLVGLVLVAAVAAAHVVVLARVGAGRVLPLVLASLGAVSAASALVPVAARISDDAVSLAAPLLGASLVALALELLTRRMPAPTTRAATWSAAIVAGIALLVVAGIALVHAVTIAAWGADRWSLEGGTSLDTRSFHVWAVLALAAVALLTAGAWAIGGTLRARRLVIVSAGLGVLVLAVPLTGQLWTAVLGWLVLAAVGVALLIVGGRRGWGAGIRFALVGAGLAALALSYSASWASIDTWWFASVGAVALLVVARAATPLVPLRGALIGSAVVLAFVAIGSEAWHTNERFQGGADARVDALHAVLFLAILLVVLATLLAPRLSALESRVLFWLAFATGIVAAGMSAIASAFAGAPALVFPEWWTSTILGALLLGALVLWVVVRRTFVVERLAASVAIAPVAAWWGDSLGRLLVLPGFMLWITPMLACLAVAAVSLALGDRGSRVARDIGVGVVVAPLLFSAITSGTDATWLGLVTAGVIALLLAVSRDGLFASQSPRKHLGWLALALAFAGLAWTLAERDVTDLEPYVLPLTGALLVIALLAWRANRTSPVPAYIALAALLVSIVPLAAVSGTGDLTRTAVVAAVSTALLLAGSLMRGSAYLDVAAVAGGAGVVISGFARPFALAVEGTTADLALDAWLAGTLLVVLVAAVGQSRAGGNARRTVAQLVVGAVLALIVVIEVPVLRDEPLGTARALALTAVLAAVFVAGLLRSASPFTRFVGWVALALAAIVVVAGSVVRAVDPFEWGTGILALALLVVGAVTLRRSPTAGSWPWLAPGLLVLLLPSLAATFVDQPVWRLVGLGLACVAALIIGAVRKLQAPLIIGSVVVLVHAIRTFSPQLVAVYQITEWWVWAVVGGAVIIFVAVTFERRMRDLKSVGGRIAALR